MPDGELLQPREEHAYRLLLRLSAARPAEVAELASLPRDDAAVLLEGLRAKGLAVAQPGDDPVYRALPPDVALGAALLRRQESLEIARQTVASLSEEYRTSARSRDPHHLVEVITGGAALRERLRDLQNSAREEILWFCRANPIAMQGTENSEQQPALTRGVRYRTIYERALLEAPGELDSVAEGVSWGEEARTLPLLPVRLAIIDRSTALCPLVRDEEIGVGEPTTAVIGRSQLLDALLALFETHWDLATPLRWSTSGALEDPGPALDDGERFLLSLFVGGMPDKSIATQMSVSRRTVQRRLERLMALAGVDTRTGLAYQAARLGWL